MKSFHGVFHHFGTVLVIFLSLNLNASDASIWIKNVKAYGPTAAAHGVKCLSIMTKYYLKKPQLSRTRNLVVSYTRNLSIPADNVQLLYLKWIHGAILNGEMDE